MFNPTRKCVNYNGSPWQRFDIVFTVRIPTSSACAVGFLYGKSFRNVMAVSGARS